MIFQQFNLLESKTIYDNIAIPLKLNGVPQKEIERRVIELLEFVELLFAQETEPKAITDAIVRAVIALQIFAVCHFILKRASKFLFSFVFNSLLFINLSL